MKRAEAHTGSRSSTLLLLALTLGGGSSAWAKSACADRLEGSGKISGVPFSVVNAAGSMELPSIEAGNGLTLGKSGYSLSLAPNLRGLKVIVRARESDQPTVFNLLVSEGIANVSAYINPNGTLTVAILDHLDEMVSIYHFAKTTPPPAKGEKMRDPTLPDAPHVEQLGKLETPRSVGFGNVSPIIQFDANGKLLIAHRNGYMFMDVNSKTELFHSSTQLPLRTHTQSPRSLADGSLLLSDGKGNYQVLNSNFAESYSVSLGETPTSEAVLKDGATFVAKGASKTLALQGQEHAIK